MKLFLCLLFILPGLLRAQQCDYNIQAPSFAANLTRANQTLESSMSVSRGSSSTPNCGTARIYTGKGQANSYDRRAYSGGNSVPYNLYSSINLGNPLKDYPEAVAGEYIEVFMSSSNAAVPVTAYVALPNLDTIFSTPPGVYTDVIPFHYYAVRSNGSLDLQTSRYVTISIQIPRFAELSLVSQNAPHDAAATQYIMDFGALETGKERRADLIVLGNVGFGVLMSSQNGGRLVNGVSHVQYRLQIGNGPQLNLSPAGNQYQVIQRPTATTLAGSRYPLNITLQNVPTSLATGAYEDVITITVQAW